MTSPARPQPSPQGEPEIRPESATAVGNLRTIEQVMDTPKTAAETSQSGEAEEVSAADSRILALAEGSDERRTAPATADALDALQARINLARGLISHRLDMSDPNVRLLDDTLAGHPIAALVAREVRP